jgi:putative Mg2+ transporter-C (MgtC) family protein
MSFGEMVLRLVIALVLGSLIGMERETHGRPAGLRTHVLVCMGSTLFTMASFIIGEPMRAEGLAIDPGRIAAQIVTGIGFLGAGTIIHQGSIVRGLTTAASIWVVAAIGLAVGIGTPTMIGLATVASVLVFGTLYLMGRLDRFLLATNDERRLSITTGRDSERLCEILQLLPRHHARLRSIDCMESDAEGMQILRLRLRVGRDFDEVDLGSALAADRYVISYSWE